MSATLLMTALAGCVKPVEETPEDCEGWSRYWCEYPDGHCEGCCDDCGWCACSPAMPPAPPPEPVHPCPFYETSFSEPAYLTCAPPPPPPPLLAPFAARRIAEACECCAEVSLASDGLRLFVATERALLVAAEDQVARVDLAEPLRAPHVAVGLDGRAWVVGLVATASAVPSVALLAYDGGGDFAETATLPLQSAPVALLAQRAYVAPVRGGALVVLDTGDAAWSVEYRDGAFGDLQAVTPAGGEARVGAPAVDARGRVLVPYAFTPRDPARDAADLVLPALVHPALYYASLGPREDAWSTRGGMVAPQGMASAPAIETGLGGVGALLFVDASGALQRVDTWDDGSSWGAPVAWSDPYAFATGAPTGVRAEHLPTAAWWEERDEGVALVVARSHGAPEPAAREHVALLDAAPSRAALATLAGRLAAVAWATPEGEVWAAVEGGALPTAATPCDDGAHCVAPHAYRW